MAEALASGEPFPVGPTSMSLRLRELRGRHIQKEVAVLLGVSTALVSSWEAGLACPPRQRLEQYAAAFGGSRADELLDELLALRRQGIGVVRPVSPFANESLLDVMREIRTLLWQIRDRLPPSEDSP